MRVVIWIKAYSHGSWRLESGGYDTVSGVAVYLANNRDQFGICAVWPNIVNCGSNYSSLFSAVHCSAVQFPLGWRNGRLGKSKMKGSQHAITDSSRKKRIRGWILVWIFAERVQHWIGVGYWGIVWLATGTIGWLSLRALITFL